MFEPQTVTKIAGIIRMALMLAITAVGVFAFETYGVREALFAMLALGGVAMVFDVFVLPDSMIARELEPVVTRGEQD